MRGYQTKKEMIYETVKQEIYDGVRKFDEKLVISHLAKRFSSSEIPVREALNLLKSDGLVEFKPHVGAVVNSISKEDIKNIFELRIILEGLATRLAASNLTASDLASLQNNINQAQEAINREDSEDFSKLNLEFHMIIYNKSNNKLLEKYILDLWKNTNRYPSIFKSNVDFMTNSLLEHKDIYESLKDFDGITAELKMFRHKSRAAKAIMKLKGLEYYENLNN